MISIIKNICIFMIIAQAVLFFVPDGAYMKYVRILVGIFIILRITEPLFGFLMDEDREEEMKERIREWEAGIEYESYDLEIEDGSMGIYSGIEEELKEKLDQCESDYQVKKVELVKDLSGDNMEVVVTVSPKQEVNAVSGENIKNIERIQIAPVVIGDEEEENAGAGDPHGEGETYDGELEKLKELYGAYIGADPERMEIRWEAD